MGASCSRGGSDEGVTLDEQQQDELMRVMANQRREIAQLRSDREELTGALSAAIDESDALRKENDMLHKEVFALREHAAARPEPSPGPTRLATLASELAQPGLEDADDLELTNRAAFAATSAAETVRLLSQLTKEVPQGPQPSSRGRSPIRSPSGALGVPGEINVLQYEETIAKIQHWQQELRLVSSRLDASNVGSVPEPVYSSTRVDKEWAVLPRSLSKASATTGASLLLLETAIRSMMDYAEDRARQPADALEARIELMHAAEVSASSLEALIGLARRIGRCLSAANNMAAHLSASPLGSPASIGTPALKDNGKGAMARL